MRELRFLPVDRLLQNRMKSILKKRSGQVLIESMIAATVAVVGLLGLIYLLTQSFVIERQVSDKFVATYLAAEGVEIVKGIFDLNYVQDEQRGDFYNNFHPEGNYQLQYNCQSPDIDTPDEECKFLGSFSDNKSTKNLLYSDSTYLYNYEEGIETPFTRTIEVRFKTDPTKIDSWPYQEGVIISTVEWDSRSGHQMITIEGHYFDWRRVGLE